MLSPSQRLALTVMATTAMALSASAALAADEPTTGSLCDAVSGGIDELSALRFVPVSEETAWCDLDTAPSQDGPHAVILATMSGFTLDDVLEMFPESTEVMVGGQPGLLDGTVLQVEIADGVLMVDANVASSAENDGVETIDFITRVAELAMANLGEPVAEAPPVAVIVLPEIASLTWEVIREASGDDFAAALSEGDLEMWTIFLASLDADFGQLRQLEADIVDAESGEGLGRYSGVRVEGADASRMQSGFLILMRQAGDQAGIAVEEAEIDGRAAIIVSLSPEQPLVFLADGDTMHGVDAPEEVLAAFVEALQ